MYFRITILSTTRIIGTNYFFIIRQNLERNRIKTTSEVLIVSKGTICKYVVLTHSFEDRGYTDSEFKKIHKHYFILQKKVYKLVNYIVWY